MSSVKSELWILCTGGAGYIGSHTAVELIQKGYSVTILDSLEYNIDIVKPCFARLVPDDRIEYVTLDIQNEREIDALFRKRSYVAVVHFAALKNLNESIHNSLQYYRNNVAGALILLDVMARNGCKNIVFSSTAAVYAQQETPCFEDSLVAPSNPYGHSKAMFEQIIKDVTNSDPTWCAAILRYFNPIGAHPSGFLGEFAEGSPNLVSEIQKVLNGKTAKLSVFGDDWPTADGTGVRDFLHVVDLAEAHVAALQWLLKVSSARDASPRTEIFNCGRGSGCSVLEMIRMFEKAVGYSIPFEIAPRPAQTSRGPWERDC